jgi:hypothetical protein
MGLISKAVKVREAPCKSQVTLMALMIKNRIETAFLASDSVHQKRVPSGTRNFSRSES